MSTMHVHNLEPQTCTLLPAQDMIPTEGEDVAGEYARIVIERGTFMLFI